MRCPFCSHPDSRVVDSRDSETGEAIRRRRECLSCRQRFTTYERVETIPLYIIKKDGRREEFQHDKLLGGLLSASKKRSIARADLERISDEVEAEARALAAPEIHSRDIGELVMTKLRPLDEIVYVRFASVYRSFRDVEDMRATLEQLLAGAPPIRGDARGSRRKTQGDGGTDLLKLER